MSAINNARLAAIAGGGTVIANAASYAETAARAWLAVSSAWAAVLLSQVTYGVTAAIMANDVGPIQLLLVSSASVAP